jgi:hypothetical protein
MWHTVPHGEGWANKVEGNSRVTNTARTKADAQAKGLKVPILGFVMLRRGGTRAGDHRVVAHTGSEAAVSEAAQRIDGDEPIGQRRLVRPCRVQYSCREETVVG